MNLHDISLRIENSSLLVSTDIPILLELTKKYPYSQLLSILYLRSLAKAQALELEEEVGKHAYKITDRGRLYEILNEKEKENEQESIVKEIFEEILVDSENTNINPIKINKEKLEENNPEEIKFEHTEEIKVEPLSAVIINDEKTLDIEVISNAISGVFEKEFEPERIIKDSIQNQSFNKENKSTDVQGNIKLNIDHRVSKLGFSTWLKLGNVDKKLVKNEKVEQIIDTFIQEDPKISQPKKEFYSPIKQAKKSLESENIQYTETLANILGIQGNYPKAILAYEQLCLTIPEKKTFFVQKIKELKEKLNS